MPSADYLETYGALSAELRRQGWFRRPTGRLMAELAFHLATFAFGVIVVVTAPNAFVWLLGVAITALGATGISTNTHTSAHFATSDRRWVNLLLAWVGHPVLGMFSVTYWWKKHNNGHHRVPNVIGVDNDCEFMPLFAYCERDVAGKSPLLRLYYRYQGALMPFLLLFHGLNIQTYDWRHLYQAIRDPEQRRLIHWMDALGLGLHWVVWVIVPSMFFPLWSVVLFHVVHRALFGIAMFVMFAPAHYPAEAVALDEGELKKDYLLMQAAATVNFRTGFIGRLYCAGVEYQIEHHFFPGISHPHYPHIAPMVEAFCRRHGYPYRTLGWGEAVWKSYLTFWRPKPVLTDLEAQRTRVEPPAAGRDGDPRAQISRTTALTSAAVATSDDTAPTTLPA